MNPPPITRLLIACADGPGIVAAASRLLTDVGANIVRSDQHTTDPRGGTFFMRMEFDLALSAEQRAELRDALRARGRRAARDAVAHVGRERPKRVAILVSRQDHCLLDLLWRWRRGQLEMDVRLVASNHPTCASDVEAFGLPYAHVPVAAGAQARRRAATARAAARRASTWSCSRATCRSSAATSSTQRRRPVPLINIHHSFLPAFAGAAPYVQAKERGVKLIGATAHYVTEGLDEGPIIEQDTVRVYAPRRRARADAPRRRHRAHGARARRAVALRRPRARRRRDNRRVLSTTPRQDLYRHFGIDAEELAGAAFDLSSDDVHAARLGTRPATCAGRIGDDAATRAQGPLPQPPLLARARPARADARATRTRPSGCSRSSGCSAPRTGSAGSGARRRPRREATLELIHERAADRADRAARGGRRRRGRPRHGRRRALLPRRAARGRRRLRDGPRAARRRGAASASPRCARPAITPNPTARWASACSTTSRSPPRWRSPSSARGACSSSTGTCTTATAPPRPFARAPTCSSRASTRRRSIPAPARCSDVGSGAGEGYTINLPVPAGSGEELWLSLVEHVVLPAARAFAPDLVLVSAGFDAHRADPLADCALRDAARSASWRATCATSRARARVAARRRARGRLRTALRSRSRVRETLLALRDDRPPRVGLRAPALHRARRARSSRVTGRCEAAGALGVARATRRRHADSARRRRA